MPQYPTGWSDFARRPGGSAGDVYAWGDKPEILGELETRKLATLARWQPELEYDVAGSPGKHVVAVVFFTPEGVNGTKSIDVSAKDNDEEGINVLYFIN